VVMKKNYLLAWGTDAGTGKRINQDSLLVKQAVCKDTRIVLAVLCDGMGGLKKGEVASASLVRAFSEWFEAELPAIAVFESPEEEILRSWDTLIMTMNAKILEYGRKKGIRLGTTMTAMLFMGEEYYLVHVGDSRAYKLTDRLYQLTKDQTLVQREVDQGLLTKEQAAEDSRRGVLLQCVGGSEKVEPMYDKGRIGRNSVYVLCCDGFRHVITGQEIYQALNPSSLTDESVMEERCAGLITLNKERGEQDNISVIVIHT